MKTSKTTLTRIIDGDTVVTQGTRFFLFKGPKIRIRLYGIDAPESEQQGGTESTNTLKRLTGDLPRQIYLTDMGTDPYNRTIGIISTNAEDPSEHYNLQMLRKGQAHAYMLKKDSPFRDHYEKAESQARAERLGIWKTGTLDRPADFRRRQEAAQAKRKSLKRLLYAGAAALILAAAAYYLWADDAARIFDSITGAAAGFLP